jgi:hypothetical protein
LLVTVPLRYLRPGHHPSTEADTQMAMDYLETSPAAREARERAESHAHADAAAGARS